MRGAEMAASAVVLAGVLLVAGSWWLDLDWFADMARDIERLWDNLGDFGKIERKEGDAWNIRPGG